MGGGSKQPAVQKQEITQSTLPEYARPYYEGLMQRASTQLTTPYTPYDQERIAGFTPEQQQLQQNILNQQTPGQFGTASTLATAAGLGSLQAGQYTPSQFGSQQIGMPNLQQYSMTGPQNIQAAQASGASMAAPQNVQAGRVSGASMQAAQANFNPQVQAYMMGNARDVGTQGVNASEMQGARTSFGQDPLEQFRMEGPEQFGGVQAERYMSPFAQNVTDIQKREAIRDAQKGQLVQDLGAARQGTYGGSRQLLAGLERERNLGMQLGDIQARGSQAAYENAQAQFERDRAAGMTTGRENLQAALGQQQLGVSTGMQSALANLSNEQQARVNNQAQQFQAQGMNAENALRASLANQGVDVTRLQANQQAQMQAQQLSTQTGLQTALANLDATSQAKVQNLAAQMQAQGINADQALRASLANQQAQLTVGQQNLAAQLQTQGLNSEQAMRAALANQQAGLTVGQQNLGAALDTQRLGAQTGLAALQSNQQANLDMQRMAEQSRQFGSQQGLAGLGQAGQMAQTLSNIGTGQSQADQARLGMQQSTAAQQQALQQQYLDTANQDFLRQQGYPMEQLQQYSSLLRGVPVTPSTTTTAYAPNASIGSQLMGGGLAAAGIYNTFRGG